MLRDEGSPDLLRASALVFGVGWLWHNLDHLRRGLDVLTVQVIAGGTVIAIAAVITVAMVFAGHRSAARVSILVGFVTAVAVSAAHLLPDWGVYSDGLPGAGVDGWTWAAVLLEIGGALLLGAAGLLALGREGATTPQPAPTG